MYPHVKNTFNRPVLSKLLSEIAFLTSFFRKGLKNNLNSAIELYIPKDKKQDKSYIRQLKKDMLFCQYNNLISFNQYFVFGFERLNSKGRYEFVGDYEKKKITYSLHSDEKVWMTFKNKFKAYQTFKKYYQREMIEILNENDCSNCVEFVKHHDEFMLKAIDKAEGEDIFRIKKTDCSEEKILDRIMKSVPCVLEEIIVQSEEMAVFHPFSVNTVRFVTFRKDNGIVNMFSFLRIGCGDSVIDNAGAGGIAAAIDINTGIVKTMGYRENGECYLTHPDTGVQIIGAHIPRWNELLALVEELVQVVPEQRYVGWDLALTDKGWCMVEGNDRAMMTVIQMCEGKGLRTLIDDTFYSVIKKNIRGIK